MSVAVWRIALEAPAYAVNIVPDEYNVLIHPLHGDAAAIASTTLKRWTCDPSFFP